MKLTPWGRLICPDCRGDIRLGTHLACLSCGRIFDTRNHILDLLPSCLNEWDMAEDHFWSTDKREGMNAPPSVALLSKRADILHFYEKVLPDLRLEGNVLEVGSGSCWLSSLIKLSFPEAFVVSSDVSFNALQKGQQLDRLLNAGIDKFIACKLEALPFDNEQFDYVFGSAVLHHANPRLAVQQIFRTLKKGGTFFDLGEPAMPRFLGLLWGSRFGRAGQRERELGVREGKYTFKEWQSFLGQAGFQETRYSLRIDPRYTDSNWPMELYYRATLRMPSSVVIRHLGCVIIMRAKK